MRSTLSTAREAFLRSFPACFHQTGKAPRRVYDAVASVSCTSGLRTTARCAAIVDCATPRLRVQRPARLQHRPVHPKMFTALQFPMPEGGVVTVLQPLSLQPPEK